MLNLCNAMSGSKCYCLIHFFIKILITQSKHVCFHCSLTTEHACITFNTTCPWQICIGLKTYLLNSVIWAHKMLMFSLWVWWIDLISGLCIRQNRPIVFINMPKGWRNLHRPKRLFWTTCWEWVGDSPGHLVTSASHLLVSCTLARLDVTQQFNLLLISSIWGQPFWLSVVVTLFHDSSMPQRISNMFDMPDLVRTRTDCWVLVGSWAKFCPPLLTQQTYHNLNPALG